MNHEQLFKANKLQEEKSYLENKISIINQAIQKKIYYLTLTAYQNANADIDIRHFAKGSKETNIPEMEPFIEMIPSALIGIMEKRIKAIESEFENI